MFKNAKSAALAAFARAATGILIISLPFFAAPDSAFAEDPMGKADAVINKTAKSSPPDLLERFKTYGENDDRVVLINGDIDAEMAQKVIGRLRYLSARSPTEPIEIHINSTGGRVNSGFAIYDYMQHVPNKISTVVIGQAASMAAFIASTGTPGMRKITESSEIMHHKPTAGAKGNAQDIAVDGAQLKVYENLVVNILSKRTNWPVEYLRDMMKQDFYLTGAQAVEMGFADIVIPPDETKAQYVLTRKPSLPAEFCTAEVRRELRICQDRALARTATITP